MATTVAMVLCLYFAGVLAASFEMGTPGWWASFPVGVVGGLLAGRR